MGRSFKNDPSEAKEALSNKFRPYPAGDYIMEIIDVEDAEVKSTANKGKPTLNLQLRIVEPEEFAGKKFRAWGIPLFQKWASGKVAFQHYQFGKAIGVDFSDDAYEFPENEDLWEQQIGVSLSIEDSNKPDPDDPEKFQKQNRVVKYYPADEGIKIVPTNGDAEDGEFDL